MYLLAVFCQLTLCIFNEVTQDVDWIFLVPVLVCVRIFFFLRLCLEAQVTMETVWFAQATESCVLLPPLDKGDWTLYELSAVVHTGSHKEVLYECDHSYIS